MTEQATDLDDVALIDAHVHLWRWADLQHRWVPPQPLARDFLPADYAATAREAGVVASILVEAGSSLDELEMLRSDEDSDGHIVGVVASLDLTAPDARDQVERLATTPRIRAARMNVESHPDPHVLRRPEVNEVLGAVAEANLGWEWLVAAEQLPDVRTVMDAHPDLRALIEHLGKPRLDEPAAIAAWRTDMAALAADTTAVCKLSYGFRADVLGSFGAGPATRPMSQLQPVVDGLLEMFGASRLCWASDWPLSSLFGTYADGLAAWRRLLRWPAADVGRRIFADNAAAFYGVGP
jgi:L-fuconolactonase